jgi:DNA-binding transcriptional LysR family regulator
MSLAVERRAQTRPSTTLKDAEGAFAGAPPRGMLRIEVQGTLARHFLMPGFPEFLVRYPQSENPDERERPLGPRFQSSIVSMNETVMAILRRLCSFEDRA